MKNKGLAVFKYYSDKTGFFPIIPLLILTKNKKLKINALIDSGATISVFKEEIAEQLGIEVESGQKITLGGVGGRIVGFIHKLKVRIADKELICPVVFSHEYLVSLNLLGRSVFFEKFKIIFEENKKILRLE